MTNDPKQLLAELEADTNGYEFLMQRAAVFRDASRLFREQGDEKGAAIADWKATLFDFMLVHREEGRARGFGRFAPMVEMGDGRIYPNVDALPDDSLLAFKDAAESSTNPIHRAVFADFVWEQRSRYPGEKREPPAMALVAIDSYLDAAGLYRSIGRDIDLVDALDRACELSQSLGNQDRIERCKAESFRFARELIAAKSHPEVRWALDVLETIQKFGKRLSKEDHEQVLALAKDALAFYQGAGQEGPLVRSFLQIIRTESLALGDIAGAELAKTQGAASFVAEADQADNPIAKQHILLEALRATQEAGDKQGADELKRQLSEVGKEVLAEMKTVKIPFAMPTDVVDAWVDELASAGIGEAIVQLATTKRVIPDFAMVRAQAQRSRQQTPLQYLGTRHTIDDQGRVVDRAYTDDEQVAASESDAYKIALMLGAYELGQAFDRLEADGPLTHASLMQFLQQAGVISDETVAVVAVGLERYFAGDYVSALHVLVPQFEDAVRDTLARLGIARTSIQQGTMREKPLDIVLATPEVRAILGDDLTTFLERFLLLSGEANLRNRTAHGLVKGAHCTREMVRWVIFSFLQLAGAAWPPAPEA